MRQTVVGVFDRYAAAQQAANALASRGIDPDCIHVTGPAGQERGADLNDDDTGVVGHIRHFFAELFGPDDEREVGQYADAVRNGAAVVKVDVEDEPRIDLAREALLDAGAVDIEEHAALRRGAASGAVAASKVGRSATVQEDVIPVVKEELEVGKRSVSSGGVRVYARTLETPVQETLDLASEHARVERRPVNRPATAADLLPAGERTLEVRETAEKAVVHKSARVVEEVVVGKDVSHEQKTVRDQLKRTEVEVERLGAGSVQPFESYDGEFRSHFGTSHGSAGSRYEDYLPAYRFGHGLASDSRYAGRRWEEVEADARRDWTTAHPGSPWERAKLAVRHAWERVSG
ncbi:YsnF/AvaK domain-containing protein [Aquabacterium sp. A7-Y]|uniref:YsnF/AvaK domain-containing protein n=1 Tax=Aquabacterium sp. A7-Y TaxID=1349605 RepID=UPI00223E08B3|nr:YsnF/AvaK domain-containing protein [Aquabacterium sp. A7-Y]MCW7540828.1 YsnF/AvaK domain-containing protein [Aquabacterium sp. A7-Y]